MTAAAVFTVVATSTAVAAAASTAVAGSVGLASSPDASSSAAAAAYGAAVVSAATVDIAAATVDTAAASVAAARYLVMPVRADSKTSAVSAADAGHTVAAGWNIWRDVFVVPDSQAGLHLLLVSWHPDTDTTVLPVSHSCHHHLAFVLTLNVAF